MVKKYNQTSSIINSLKRSFSRSPIIKEVMDEVRFEEVWYKKDGTPAVKPRVLFKCANCYERHMRKNIQCDHIEPVIPLEIPGKHMDLGMICFRLFCSKNGLQILCKPCHKEKSKEENRIRREWKKKEKHIVYMTTNMKNSKMYIGVHKCVDLDDGYLGSGTLLKKAIKKYGKENFIRKVLFVFDNIQEAYEKEKEIVWEWMVESAEKGKIAGNQNPMYGKTHSKEIKKKIGDRKYPTGSDHKKSRKVRCINTGEVFDSITEATNSLNKKSTVSIGRVCRGERKTAYGLKWEFVNEKL